jgi:hypothetical protein
VRRQLAARDADGAGVARVDAEDGLHDLGAAGADQPGERDDLPGADAERDVAEGAGARQALDLEDDVAGLDVGLGEQRAELAADHAAHDLVDREAGERVGGDVRAVPHHRDAVAERGDLVEPVGDEEHGGAGVPQRPRDAEQALDLDTGQRGGGLVHDDDARVERERLRDLDDLLVGDREAAGRAARVDRDAEALEQRGRGPVELGPVDAAEPAGRLPAHEDVLRDAEVREQRGLLVDDGDAGRLRVGRAAEGQLRAVEDDRAGVRAVHAGEQLDDRRLARAVLADKRVDLAAVERERDVAGGRHGAERLRDTADLQERRRRRRGHVISSAK